MLWRRLLAAGQLAKRRYPRTVRHRSSEVAPGGYFLQKVKGSIPLTCTPCPLL